MTDKQKQNEFFKAFNGADATSGAAILAFLAYTCSKEYAVAERRKRKNS